MPKFSGSQTAKRELNNDDGNENARKGNRFNKQNNNFACEARFLPEPGEKFNYLKQKRMFPSPSKLGCSPQEHSSGKIHVHLTF